MKTTDSKRAVFMKINVNSTDQWIKFVAQELAAEKQSGLLNNSKVITPQLQYRMQNYKRLAADDIANLAVYTMRVWETSWIRQCLKTNETKGKPGQLALGGRYYQITWLETPAVALRNKHASLSFRASLDGKLAYVLVRSWADY